MDKSYVSLTLSAVEASGVSQLPTRKSLRRSWNRLPRCQRNLILLGVVAVGATLFFLLPGEHIVAQQEKQLSAGSAGAFSFSHWGRQSGAGTADGGGGAASHINVRDTPDEDDVNAGNNLNRIEDVESDNEPRGVASDVLPQFKEAPNGLAPHVENVVKLPETQESAYEANNNIEESLNKINIPELDINNNNIEPPAAEPAADADVRLHLKAAVQEPDKLPLSNGLSINDFLSNLDASDAAQKQHFHGATNERQQAVVAAFKHSWSGYKKYAWGHDNLKPISQTSQDWFGLGLTIVDSLDTLYIMGLEDEFLEARDWVSEFLLFDINRDVNLFEVTIRVLGGLLASYHLSGDKVFLKKSIELGNRLLPCFLSPSGIPYSDVNLASMSAHSPKWSPDSSTSEVTTIQLEFRDLSRVSNVPIYERVVEIVNEKVHALEKNDGLVPIFINANTGTFRSYSTISLGARGDSYYEYLLKQWLQTGRKQNDVLIQDYLRAIDGVITKLMRRTPKDHHVYVGELINGKDFKPKMDHLTCYLPGTLLLGHKYGMPDSHLLLAKDLLETCYQTYMQQPTHLAPEISYFAINDNEELDIYVKPNDAHNLLRPEFVESLYYFYALSGNRTYQDMGWHIFQAFEKHTKVASGYTSIGNVKNVFNTRLRDMMESFWLGETLKYFYLLFSDNRKEIDLDKWIFNTEAHPLPKQQQQH